MISECAGATPSQLDNCANCFTMNNAVHTLYLAKQLKKFYRFTNSCAFVWLAHDNSVQVLVAHALTLSQQRSCQL